MIQLTKKSPHTPRDVLAFSENHKKHELSIKTFDNGKKSEFIARLNKKELKELCLYIENNFPIHKKDL